MALAGSRIVCLFSLMLLLTSLSAAQSLSEIAAVVVVGVVVIVLATGAELQARHHIL